MEKKIEEIVRLLSKDKRAGARLQLAVSVYYRLTRESVWQGPFTAVNIGGNGVSFILACEIAKHTELDLRIVLPPDPQRPIEVRGEVVWVSVVDDRYRLGVRFFKMQEDDRRRFVSYICDSILVNYAKQA